MSLHYTNREFLVALVLMLVPGRNGNQARFDAGEKTALGTPYYKIRLFDSKKEFYSITSPFFLRLRIICRV